MRKTTLSAPSAIHLTDQHRVLRKKRLRMKMERERFEKLVAEVLDTLPREFRDRMHNLAILIEDRRPRQSRRQSRQDNWGPHQARPLLLGLFEGVPATKKSVFDLCSGPDRITLYQRNIEAVCSNEDQIRHEVRQTVLHELGHYFGLDEDQLRDV